MDTRLKSIDFRFHIELYDGYECSHEQLDELYTKYNMEAILKPEVSDQN
jgi:hypothetical protein